ncbi:Probable RNA-directed DNA polymerase from transposon X-element [Eumeta japonica]|uniref:Probable RNA-directed DNA polymerase from transposon X-element n=1 Tax=Eumeta variegata TaxID=151549 RepID=A0A4C1Y305_EUMVA|nr:Probable RNA-directed DNA polymerase from transposon X-element [Eumeta japonica]
MALRSMNADATIRKGIPAVGDALLEQKKNVSLLQWRVAFRKRRRATGSRETHCPHCTLTAMDRKTEKCAGVFYLVNYIGADLGNCIRPISLLPIPSKIYESLLLLRILPLVEQHKIIPDHQFGFRRKHATVDQIHRLINEIDKSFESKEYCASVFLDISQAFDRVWHEGLLFKIKSSLPNYICQILESFIQNRRFVVQHGEALSRLCDINAGVPQGSVLGPLLYLIYTSDLPTSDCITTGTFADDTAILASHQDPAEASKSYRMALTIF